MIERLEADWPAPAGIVAGTTLATDAGSTMALHVAGQTDKASENRQELAAALGIGEPWQWLHQVHGSDVFEADATAAEEPPVADALYSAAAGRTLAIMTADCLPVLFVSADGVSLAAAHAGWRGLVAGVLETTVAKFSQPRESIMAWLGPAISQAAFEVGDEVRRAFVERNPSLARHFVANSRQRWQADLDGIARALLADLGLVHVYGGGWCTFTENRRFFSYRRDPNCGRMASFIGRRRHSTP